MDQSVPCNLCGGTGRVKRLVAQIIRDAVESAAEHYWPAAEVRWAAAKGEMHSDLPNGR